MSISSKHRQNGEHFQFFHPSLESATLCLDDTESRHMVSVLRLKCDTPVQVTDGRGGTATAVITAISRSSVTLSITSRVTQARPSPSVTLLLGMPEKDAFETVIVNATALGVERIIPVVTDYSQNPWWNSSWEKLTDRFTLKMITALKQSKQFYLPTLDAPVSTEAAMSMATGQLLVADSSGAPVFSVLQKEQTIDKFTIVIGPPGGLSDNELTAFVARGFASVAIAKSRLRTELAATTLLGQIVGYTL